MALVRPLSEIGVSLEEDAGVVSRVQLSRKIFREAASEAWKAERVDCKPLRPNIYSEDGKSVIALVRARDRRKGILEALNILGGIQRLFENMVDGYVLVKPNCNSFDPFPASTHPATVKLILKLLREAGLRENQLILGDMSGPAWLPTEETMKRNGVLGAALESGVQTSFFEDESWMWVEPENASSWPEGFRIAETA